MFLLYCVFGFFIGMYLVKLTKQHGSFKPEWEGSTTFIFIFLNTFCWPAIILYIGLFCIVEEMQK